VSRRSIRGVLVRLATVAAGACALIAAIPAAYAGTVGVSATSPDDVTFVAQAGERNALEVIYPSQVLIVTDSGAELTSGAGCVSLGPNSAQCEIHPNVNAYLADKDDRARVSWAGRVQVWAGSGNDDVVASSFGTAGIAYGEAGNDILGAVGEGGQLADGGPGDDVLNVFAFGGESTANGGDGRDVIEFRHAGTTSIGPATLDGGSGADTILAQPTWTGTSTANGGPGNDVIVITSAPPFFGLGSSYQLIGGSGADLLTGGATVDTVDGGDGADVIDVRDGGADSVVCGAGVDVVRHDASDTVAADCELRLN
jgi:Ca2+-binding RTX toxin-like protein